MAEALTPIASFGAESPKPGGVVERVKQRVSPEQRRNHRMEKAVERNKRSVPASRIANMEATRGQKGRALNLSRDSGFNLAVFKETQKAVAQHGLSREVSGNQYQISPAELADIHSRAFAEFAKDDPQRADYYRREGLHFSKPDRNGNCRVDYRADPFMRAVDQQAQELRSGGNDTDANSIMDSFARDCRDKAEMYAAAGHKGMKEALQRIGQRSVDATPAAATSATAPLEAAPVTQDLTAIKLSNDIARYQELSSKTPGSLSFAQENERRTLVKDHEGKIKEAQRLADEFRADPSKTLSPDELAQLEQYQVFLKTPDATAGNQTAVATGTAATAEAQKAQAEKQVRDLGSEAMGKLQASGVDFSKMTEAQALHALKDGVYKDANGNPWIDDLPTQEYIRGAFAEHKKQQAEAAIAALPQGLVDKLSTKEGFNKKDILAILLAFLAAGAISVGKDAAATVTT